MWVFVLRARFFHPTRPKRKEKGKTRLLQFNWLTDKFPRIWLAYLELNHFYSARDWLRRKEEVMRHNIYAIILELSKATLVSVETFYILSCFFPLFFHVVFWAGTTLALIRSSGRESTVAKLCFLPWTLPPPHGRKRIVGLYCWRLVGV